MSRYIKCMLTLETHEEFDILLSTMERTQGGYLGEKQVVAVRSIVSALKYHRDTTGYRKFSQE